MAPWLFKTVTSLFTKNSAFLHEPPICKTLILFSTSIEKTDPKVTIYEYLVNQQKFSPEIASKVLSSSTKYINQPQNADKVLNFLAEFGFSRTHVVKIVTKMPEILSYKLDKKIEPKIKILLDFGFESSDIVDFVSVDPWVLDRSGNNLGPSLLALKNVLGTDAGIVSFLKRSSSYLLRDLEKSVMPNVKFLKSCGISLSQIVMCFYQFPRFFLRNTENLKDIVERVDQMRFDRSSKMFIHAIRTMSSMTLEKWELKLKLFRDLGFSETDILSVFRSSPQVFAVSEKKIKEVTEVVLSFENSDISYIVKHPELLIYSVNERLKPRIAVLKALYNKNLLKKKPNLITVCKFSSSKFVKQYVNPYSDELGDLSFASYSHRAHHSSDTIQQNDSH